MLVLVPSSDLARARVSNPADSLAAPRKTKVDSVATARAIISRADFDDRLWSHAKSLSPSRLFSELCARFSVACGENGKGAA